VTESVIQQRKTVWRLLQLQRLRSPLWSTGIKHHQCLFAKQAKLFMSTPHN